MRRPRIARSWAVARSCVPGFDKGGWTGMFIQAKVPEPIVGRVYQAVTKVMKDPEAVKKLAEDGLVAVASPPVEFSKFVQAEIEEWAKVVDKMKLPKISLGKH